MNEEIRQRTKWFMDARFGMFIHWGLYSIPACGEWMMSAQRDDNPRNTTCSILNSLTR